jgi:DNA-binding HxlR family transcriptional regulator
MKKREQLPIQPCSTQELEEALELLEGRWKILILFHRFSAPVLRFSELQTVAHRLIRPRKRLSSEPIIKSAAHSVIWRKLG